MTDFSFKIKNYSLLLTKNIPTDEKHNKSKHIPTTYSHSELKNSTLFILFSIIKSTI